MYYSLINSMSKTPALDADALAFITAASITDAIQKSAINTLVKDLKTASIWTKMKAIYPFVGGTAAQHRFNLKDPRDLNVAYCLDFSGGWTHDYGGVLPNGTNSYANSYLTPSSSFNTTTFNHLSYYSRTNDDPSNYPYEMGSYSIGANGLRVRRTGNQGLFFADYPSGTSYKDVSSSSITSGLGLFIGSQTGTNIKMYRNATVIASNTTATSSTSQSTYPIYLGTLNGLDVLTANRWSAKKCGFASIGDGLTDTEVSAFYTAVQNFNTTLSRQV